MTRGSWWDELSSRLRDVSQVEPGYRDFGGKPLAPPSVCVRTTSAEEVAHVLEVATRHALPVTVRGAGHSGGGQTAAPGGILLRHCPPGVRFELQGEVAQVPGHWAWHPVEEMLRAEARDLLVATSVLEATVGGTLSMGGIGVRSIRRGAQVDHVTGLELICADGRSRFCSPTQEPDLFRSALTGAGQVGIIERAWMTTARHRAHLACSSAHHASLRELAGAIAWMGDLNADVPEYFSALLRVGVLESTAATAHASEPAARRALGRRLYCGGTHVQHRVQSTRAFEQEERAMPGARWWRGRNLWCDYCFDAAGFASFCGFVDDELWDGLRGHLAYALCIAPARCPPLALDLRPRTDRRLFSLGLFYSMQPDDEIGIANAERSQARALEVCVALGGRPYLHGCWGGRDGLSFERARSLFGAGHERLSAWRARLDPCAILNPHGLSAAHAASGATSSAAPSGVLVGGVAGAELAI